MERPEIYPERAISESRRRICRNLDLEKPTIHPYDFDRVASGDTCLPMRRGAPHGTTDFHFAIGGEWSDR